MNVLALQLPQRVPPEPGLGVGTGTLLAVLLALAALCALVIYLDRRHPPQSGDEWRHRERMSELCPHGWAAQITVHAWNAERPDDAPADPRATVAIDWHDLREDGRVRAATTLPKRGPLPSLA